MADSAEEKTVSTQHGGKLMIKERKDAGKEILKSKA